MGGKHCRLYDENLVHNIMVSTALSVLEYVRGNRKATSEDICEFVEVNSQQLIEDTIEHLNNMEDYSGKEGEEGGSEPWMGQNGSDKQ